MTTSVRRSSLVLRQAVSKLLLVERDRDTRVILQTLLDLHGFETKHVASNQDAIDCLRVEAFDLVISGFMVETNQLQRCWQQLDEIRALTRGSVGLLTGFTAQDPDLSARELSFTLVKPVTAASLLERVASSLRLPPVSSEHAMLVERYFAALEHGTYAELATICTDDVVYHLPRAPHPHPEYVVGVSALQSLAATTFGSFKSPRFALQELRSLPRGVLVRYQSSWQEQDVRRELPGAVIFKIDEMKIREIGVRCDLSQVPS